MVIILAVGFYFRFNKLGEAPAGFYLDEAAIGYNAYSVLLTDKDEYGMKLPLIFRSFGDFKAPVYSYILVPLLKYFELNEWSTRFPSALFGISTVIVLFLLIKEISENKKSLLPFVSALFLAISPWHVLFSRTTYETNLALFFLVSAILFLYKSFKKPVLMVVSALFWSLSFLTYHSERLIAPMMLCLVLISKRELILGKVKEYRKYMVLSVIVGLVMVLPTVFLFKTPGFLSRANTLSIFSTKRQMPYGYDEEYSGIFSGLVKNEEILMAREFASLYLSYFSPRYLFNLGDYEPRSSYPEMATFFVWQMPFYLVGLFGLIKEKKEKDLKFLVLTMLLISPIPAAMTRDPYSSIRALPQVIPLVVIMAYGLLKISEKIRINALGYTVGFAVLLFSLVKLNSSIFTLNEYFRAKHWEYGLKEAINIALEHSPELPIIIDNSRGEPYIQALFFTKYDPVSYQNENFEVNLGEYYTNMNRVTRKNMERITVKTIEFGEDTGGKEQYLVADVLAISDEQIRNHKMIKIADVKYPDGSVAYRVVKTRKY